MKDESGHTYRIPPSRSAFMDMNSPCKACQLGDFSTQLMLLFCKADAVNKAKLATVFPGHATANELFDIGWLDEEGVLAYEDRIRACIREDFAEPYLR